MLRRQVMGAALVLCALTAAAPAALADGIAVGSGQVFKSYVNARFGVAADVPRVGFSPEAPPANGDGRSWTGEGGAEISVFGSYWTALAEDFSGYRAASRRSLEAVGATITYAPSGANWFVFSAHTSDGRIFYDKTVTRPGCPVAGHVHLAYPEALRDVMDSIVARMGRTLHLAASPDCP